MLRPFLVEKVSSNQIWKKAIHKSTKLADAGIIRGPSDPVPKQLLNYDSLSHIRDHIGYITELDSQSYNCPPLLSTTISQRLLGLKP